MITVEMRGITKRFPGVVANDAVDLVLRAGEVHGLLGENGAGKTTLMNILFGLYQPDEGQILVKGQPVTIHSPADAIGLGIGMVHQHFKLVQPFTVTENIVLGLDGWGFFDMAEAERQIAAGALRGYLAYADGVCIGWCNANDRANYPAEPAYDVPFYAPVKYKEKAVVCFEIAPEYRMKGIATALLERVIADARDEGYTAVVGFPILRSERFEWDHAGPVRLYEKLGFRKTAGADKYDRIVMKKYPKHQQT